MKLLLFLRLLAVVALWESLATEAETTIAACSPDNNNVDISTQGPGVITTPAFPNGHNDASCIWKIQAPDKFRLEITIEVLKLEEWEDYVLIRDGGDESSLIGKYGPCASGSVTLFSSGNSVFLQAIFPVFSSKSQLRISYKPVNPDDISCTNQPENPPNFCSADTQVQQSSGVLSSPNFPNNYGAGEDCVWTLTAPQGYRVQLIIHWFGIEDHRYSRPGICADDTVVVSEKNGNTTIAIDRLCGCQKLLTHVSSHEKMWLTFYSFKKANWPGFYATYQFLSPEECPAGDTNCPVKRMPAVGFNAQGQVCTVLAKASSSSPMKTSSPSPSLSLSSTESLAKTSSQAQQTSNKLVPTTSTVSRLASSSIQIQAITSSVEDLKSSTQVTNPSSIVKSSSLTKISIEAKNPPSSKAPVVVSSYVGSTFKASTEISSQVLGTPRSQVEKSSKSPVLTSSYVKSSRTKTTEKQETKSPVKPSRLDKRSSHPIITVSSVKTRRLSAADRSVETQTIYRSINSLRSATSTVSEITDTSVTMATTTQKQTQAMSSSTITTPFTSVDLEHINRTLSTVLSPRTSDKKPVIAVTKTPSLAAKQTQLTQEIVQPTSSATPRLSKAFVLSSLVIGTEGRETVTPVAQLRRSRNASESVESTESKGSSVTGQIVKLTISSSFESNQNATSATGATEVKAQSTVTVFKSDLVQASLSSVFFGDTSSKLMIIKPGITTTRTDSETVVLKPSTSVRSTKSYQIGTFVVKSTRPDGTRSSLALPDHVISQSEHVTLTSSLVLPDRVSSRRTHATLASEIGSIRPSKASEKASKVISSNAPTMPATTTTTPQEPHDNDTAASGGTGSPPEGVSVICTHYAMHVTISRILQPSLVVSSLHLLDPECKILFANDTHALLRTPLEGCDTERKSSEDYLIYVNTIMGEAKSSNATPLITREGRVQFKFQCSYRRIHVLSIVSYSTRKKVFRTSDGGIGNFTFEMDMYEDPQYDVVINQYPFSVLPGQNMYFQVDVKSSNGSLLAFLEECWVTPTTNPRDQITYKIIQHGCPLDSTLKYPHQKSSTQKFSFQAFRFRQVPSRRLYVHCEVEICVSSDTGSVCHRGCVDNARRRRESHPYLMDEDVYLSLGPVHFKEDSAEKSSSSIVYIQALTAVLGVLILILLIAIVIVILRRRKRDRNSWILIPSKTQTVDQEKEPSTKLMEQTTEL